MASISHSLPRHTNLAPQGRRISAFFVDLAIFVLATLTFFFGAVKWVAKPNLDKYNKDYYLEELNTGLFVDIGGTTTNIASDSSFEEFRDVLSYYYMNYLTGENIAIGKQASKNANQTIDGIERKDYYTVRWFNQNVLKIGENPDSEDDEGYFTYQKNDLSQPLLDEFGIPKSNDIVPSDKVNLALQLAYKEATNNFLSQDYVSILIDKIGFIVTVEIVVCGILAAIVTYLIIPLALKNGQTLGKKINKLALANKDGYKMENYRLYLRLIPLVLMFASFLIPIWSDIFFIFLELLIIFFVSFALAMASSKKSSLHDYCAGTIVVDMSTSIIFDGVTEEEQYIFKEDGITKDEENE